MKISYNWLSEYIAEIPEPEKLSSILTSVGLEVESLEKFEEIKGGLKGLVIGEVIECTKHPDADKLTLAKVDIGKEQMLQIICGAPNITAGQKVVVATVGTTLFPLKGEPITMKKAKIRGYESEGMICAEDEISIGESHEGIIVLPDDVEIGTEASAFFNPYTDWIFELGITPNRMDAMSHVGVAKDVCAYLSHKNKKEIRITSPYKNSFKVDSDKLKIEVTIENKEACLRYSGVSISNIKVAESPKWLQQKLKSIGIRPINNIVDTTNYILHESGQPLHAFDADEIKGNAIIVKNLSPEKSFTTLDEKERILNAEDLMICNRDEEPMCFGGVFGGIKSGVKEATTNIFLESACFQPKSIRRTSLRHNLRTDASIRFEKGVDISNTVAVLKRAAMLITEIAGGEITSGIVDIYPNPKEKTEVVLKNHYLKKISGKNYHSDAIKNILQSMDFEILKEGLDDIHIAVPFSKPDITLPNDIIEEIMRIDGYDNVEIPSTITISPAVETAGFESAYKEKITEYLIGLGFSEILTNSITNSAYYKEDILLSTVKLLNNISTELDVMRPSLLETGLECIAHNINHKSNNLLLFEFGKTYSASGIGEYQEEEHLCLYASGNKIQSGWRERETKTDIYFIKGVCEKLFQLSGINNMAYKIAGSSLHAFINDELVAQISTIAKEKVEKFSVKQAVFFADIHWAKLTASAKKIPISFSEISKYPEVQRDISLVLNKNILYESVENLTKDLNISSLVNIKLFDIFESEKVGEDKRSLAINFTFSDKEKTLTDIEIDAMINKIIATYEKELGAEIRKASL
ncbi:MAG TPA: phenylalanine--tRNA ligase subunit beta [Chitinophagaceae bacterium]|nr:phenylalanine--tRNA ligase subunit beta [Chitinophagaceae bacterium]